VSIYGYIEQSKLHYPFSGPSGQSSAEQGKKRADRSELGQANIAHTFFQAIDGMELKEEQRVLYSPEAALKEHKRELVPGEIGCSLSHYFIYEKAVKENMESILILEDDAVLKQGFQEALELIDQHKDEYDLILLGHRGGSVPSFWKRKKIGKYFLAPMVNRPYGTYGYWISQQGAKLLMENCLPIRMPADLLTGKAFQWGLRSGGIFPPVIEQAHIGSNTIVKPKEVVGKNPKSFFKKLKTTASNFIKKLLPPKR